MNRLSTLLEHSPASSILDRWAAFTEALGPETIDLIDTEDAVAGLIDRSLLQERLDAGDELDSDDYARLERADRALRAAAPILLDRTQVALFRDDEPSYHWWWRLQELVLGETAQVLLNVPSAAELKGVHPHTIRLAIKDGLLPARRLARGFLIHRRDLERWQPRRVGRPARARTASADTLLDSFNDANSQGDFARAAQVAAAIELDPSTPRRKLAVALARYHAEEYDLALPWIRRSLAGEMPDRSRQLALLVQGRCFLALGRPKDARAALRKAVGVGPLDAPVHAALADTYLALGQAHQAVTHASQAVTIAPDVAGLRYVLARMEWHANLVADALEHLVECRAAMPHDEDATLLFASVLGLLGDRTGDASFYRRAIEAVEPLATTAPGAAQALGGALSRLGRTDDAVRLMQRIVRDRTGEEDWLQVAQAIGDMVLEDAPIDRRSALARVVEKAVGPVPGTRRVHARECATAGDVQGVLDQLVLDGFDPEAMTETDRLLVLEALVRADDTERAQRFANALVDADSGEDVLAIVVHLAIAVDDIELSERVLTHLSTGNGATGALAEVALRLRAAGERQGRNSALMAQALASIQALDADPSTSDRSTVAASDSSWEGPHVASTPTVDAMILAAH
jgi:tetratricopeptide (TPR) repeat protein